MYEMDYSTPWGRNSCHLQKPSFWKFNEWHFVAQTGKQRCASDYGNLLHLFEKKNKTKKRNEKKNEKKNVGMNQLRILLAQLVNIQTIFSLFFRQVSTIITISLLTWIVIKACQSFCCSVRKRNLWLVLAGAGQLTSQATHGRSQIRLFLRWVHSQCYYPQPLVGHITQHTLFHFVIAWQD